MLGARDIGGTSSVPYWSRVMFLYLTPVMAPMTMIVIRQCGSLTSRPSPLSPFTFGQGPLLKQDLCDSQYSSNLGGFLPRTSLSSQCPFLHSPLANGSTLTGALN
ncbi:hypothetical protein BDV10DRAFT_43155 [Aspergillus recurvatus]